MYLRLLVTRRWKICEEFEASVVCFASEIHYAFLLSVCVHVEVREEKTCLCKYTFNRGCDEVWWEEVDIEGRFLDRNEPFAGCDGWDGDDGGGRRSSGLK